MSDKALARVTPGKLVHDPLALGQVLAESGFFQDSRGAAQAAVKVMAGAELGFGPVTSMTGVYIVKGRVTVSANLMAAAIKRHPSYTFRVKVHTDDECVIDFIEDGEVIGTSSFSMDDAKKAGLTSSQTWKSYPRNMLYARAVSNGAKWYCPDVFGGPIYTPDELGAEIDGETGEVVNAAAFELPAPVETVSVVDAARIGGLISEANEAGVITAQSLVELVQASGANPQRVDREAIANLTLSQAEHVEAALHALLPKVEVPVDEPATLDEAIVTGVIEVEA
jgi:hypothetical protein